LMMIFVSFLIAFICCNYFVVFAAPKIPTTNLPQKCEKISLNTLVYFHANPLTNISVNIGLKDDANGNTLISYDNLEVKFIGNYSINFLCFAFNDSILCQNNDTLKGGFPIGNTTFYFHAHSPEFPSLSNLEEIFMGFVDEKNINLIDGTLFTLENPCYKRTDVGNATICCTSFKPAPPIKTASKCQEFKSRTTIYDVTDDYFIFATSQINYTYENENLHFNASFHANEGLTVEYTFNNRKIGNFEKSRPIISGTIPVTNNFKGFFEMTVHTHNPDLQDDYYVPNARIFYRNGQALIEEGNAFTSTNDCQYLSTIVSADHVASSQYCCTKFE
jgi:hypothetical protein